MAKKYNTVNLTDEQLDILERTVGLLEAMNQGPYGGKGKKVSWGQAIEYICEMTYPSLVKRVQETEQRKRIEAAKRRQNNNPGITPGVHKEKADAPWLRYGYTRKQWDEMTPKRPEKPVEPVIKSRGLLGRFFGK